MDKDKIIKEYERTAGYRVCYWCNKKIKRGQRILFIEETKKETDVFYKVHAIAACCIKCFKKYDKYMRLT